MKTGTLLIAGILAAQLCAANELQQKYEKAYYLETAKGQIEEALVIYRKIASIEATDENRESILLALARLRWHYEFPNTIPFKIGFAKFNNGDSIEILEIRGAKAPFEVGATYLVRGAYTLASRDRASIALYVTPKQRNPPTFCRSTAKAINWLLATQANQGSPIPATTFLKMFEGLVLQGPNDAVQHLNAKLVRAIRDPANH